MVQIPLVLILIGLVLAACGLVVLFRAVRGRRVGQEPRCVRCRFDLSAQVPADPANVAAYANCPECGADIRTPGATVPGVRRRSWKWACAGCLLLLIGLAPGVRHVVAVAPTVDYYRWMPTWLLCQLVGTRLEPTPSPFLEELVRRLPEPHNQHLPWQLQMTVVNKKPRAPMSGSTLKQLAKTIPHEVSRRSDCQDIQILCLIYGAAACQGRTDDATDELFIFRSTSYTATIQPLLRPQNNIRYITAWRSKLDCSISTFGSDTHTLELTSVSDEIWVSDPENGTSNLAMTRQVPEQFTPGTGSGILTHPHTENLPPGVIDVVNVAKFRSRVGFRTEKFGFAYDCLNHPHWNQLPIQQRSSHHQILVLPDNHWPGIIKNEMSTLDSYAQDVQIAVIQIDGTTYCSYPSTSSYILAVIAPRNLYLLNMRSRIVLNDFSDCTFFPKFDCCTILQHDEYIQHLFSIPSVWVNQNSECLRTNTVRVDMFTSAAELLDKADFTTPCAKTTPCVKLVFENVPVYREGSRSLDRCANYHTYHTLTVNGEPVTMSTPTTVEALTPEQALEADAAWAANSKAQMRSFTAP